eukprot:4795374-Prymnesium_polylepis.1
MMLHHCPVSDNLRGRGHARWLHSEREQNFAECVIRACAKASANWSGTCSRLVRLPPQRGQLEDV